MYYFTNLSEAQFRRMVTQPNFFFPTLEYFERLCSNRSTGKGIFQHNSYEAQWARLIKDHVCSQYWKMKDPPVLSNKLVYDLYVHWVTLYINIKCKRV